MEIRSDLLGDKIKELMSQDHVIEKIKSVLTGHLEGEKFQLFAELNLRIEALERHAVDFENRLTALEEYSIETEKLEARIDEVGDSISDLKSDYEYQIEELIEEIKKLKNAEDQKHLLRMFFKKMNEELEKYF